MSGWWQKRRKIASMPGVRHDAVTVLARTLEKAQQGTIKSVFVSIEWDDGTFAPEWSTQDRGSLAIHGISTRKHIEDEIFERGHDPVGYGGAA